MKTILCYGDSNTYGFNPKTMGRYSASERWTGILAEKLGKEYKVIEEGLNGRTTVFDRPEASWKNGKPYLLPCLLSHKPLDYVVIMLGTNDCNSNLKLSSEDIAGGMEVLIKLVLEDAKEFLPYLPKLIVVAPAPILPDYHGSVFAADLDDYSVQKSEELAEKYKALANKYSCSFIDCSVKVEVSKIDSEHLTEAGHQTLAELIYNEIAVN